MKKLLLLIILLAGGAPAQTRYEASWNSLDARPTPAWYHDAKFGIFIHWGLYSVPAFTRKGGYAEWYWRGISDTTTFLHQWHRRTYGDEFRYQDFAPLFKAELFQPDKWADLFARAGARYVVLTSKHHDGFCLWPSAQSWNWNSVDIGPHRDLLGDLTTAVRARGLRMGFYYSLLEWYNPLYQNDIHRYVAEHMLPQFKDAVTRYQPALIFSDGEWDYDSKVLRSEEFLAWLYNDSPAPKDVVVNDRWGGETRFKHGGYFSTEYEAATSERSAEFQRRGWEECRGMGRSFGFNRNEEVEDYQTAASLIHMLVEIVSRGGNLLLNIGPAADGTIPVIMQERLLQMGEWLKINGEAIYGSRVNRTLGEGDSVRFTRSADGRFLYAICLRHPGAQLRLRTVEALPGTAVRLLGLERDLDWRQEGGTLTIDLPAAMIPHLPGAYAWVFRIQARPYVEIPVIQAESFIRVGKPARVTLAVQSADARIRYTLDGREPDESSPLYTAPLSIKTSSALRARAFKPGCAPSLTAAQEISILDARANGLHYRYYEGEWPLLPDFTSLKPVREGRAWDFSLAPLAQREDKYALLFEGYIGIEQPGTYAFFTRSDDGSRLWIDETLVVDNDGLHGAKEAEGKITLSAGRHALRLAFMENGGAESLEVLYQGEGGPRQPLPPSRLFVER
ncbi:MAG TPA: alpha-L-fucosidase [bacterium]|nr:alpha-L-fucosidase [bacterium]HPR88063.1 alpha-L-fucosidase [bacterium]